MKTYKYLFNLNSIRPPWALGLGLGLVAFVFGLGGAYLTYFARGSDLPVMAEVRSLSLGTKFRDSRRFFWQTASNHQALRLGDGIYTPKGAKAVLILKHGAIMDLDEETLVEFAGTPAGRQEVPLLDRGNFVLTLQGHLTLKLAGELVDLEGVDSRVQIYLDSADQLRVHLLAGQAKLKTSHSEFALEKDKLASLQVPDISAPTLPILAQTSRVHPEQLLNEYTYVLRYNDLYESLGDRAIEQKLTEPDLVELPLELRWKSEGLPKVVYGEISRLRDFKIKVTFQAQGESYTLTKVNLGDNFWRISTDGRHWEDAYFKVSAALTKTVPPKFHITERRLDLVHGSAPVAFAIESSAAYKAYLVEISHQPVFVPGQTDLFWVADGLFQADFVKAESLYLRVRGVTPSFELSEFSPPERIHIVRTKTLGPRAPAKQR